MPVQAMSMMSSNVLKIQLCQHGHPTLHMEYVALQITISVFMLLHIMSHCTFHLS